MTASALPRISIVTPSFNQGQFLEECIDSVLSQGYPNLEYIVMDGGSTDDSIEILRRYAPHLTYWQSQADGGHYAAVAAGFARTSGEIMAWLNSDDKYCPLAFFKAAFLFAHHPDVVWLTGRPLRWSIEGHAEDPGCVPISFSRERVVVQREFQAPWICQESTFWRRQLWEQAGGGPRADLSLAGDLELWVRFFRHAPLYFAETYLGGNRRHDAQRSVLFMAEYLREADTVLDEENARPAPDETFDAPPPLAVDFVAMRPMLLDAGVPPSTIVTDRFASDLAATLVRVSSERDHFVAANRTHEEALRASEADRSSRLAALEELTRQLADSEAQRVAQVETTHRLEAERAAQDETITRLEGERAAQLETIRQQQATLQAQQDAIAALQGTLAEQQGTIAAQQGTIAGQQDTIGSTLSRIETLERALADAEQERLAARDHVARLERLLADTAAQVRRLEAELASATATLRHAEARVHAIETSLSWRTAMFVGRFAKPFLGGRR